MNPNLPEVNRKELRFWLLQATGWLPLFVLFMALYGDEHVNTTNSVLYASSAWVLAVSGTLLLRYLYKSSLLRDRNLYLWIIILVSLNIIAAELVALLHHLFWWVLAQFQDRFLVIVDKQSHVAVGVLLVPIYAAWSFLYMVMTGQDKLNQSTIEQQRLALELRDYQLDSLLRQLNPHFMFNTINNIRSLILKDKDKARDMLSSFADIMRYQINVASDPMASIKEELEFVDEYLQLSRLQMGSRLMVEVNIDPAAEPWQIPRMSIQLLVENAIKHGFSRTMEPGTLRIQVLDSPKQGLQIQVSNPGKLNPDKLNPGPTDSGIGLENLKKRLEMAFGQHYVFSLKEQGDRVEGCITITKRPDAE